MGKTSGLFVLAIGLGAFPITATSILAIYTAGVAYVGADSRISRADGSEARSGCKIHVTKDFIFASSGLFYETEGPFDLRRIARESLVDGLHFKQAIANLQETLTKGYPAFAARAMLSGVPQIHLRTDIVVVGHDPDILVSQISMDYSKPPSRLDCPGPTCSAIGVFELGERSAIDIILDRRHAIWREIGIPEAIKYLISEQMRATPQFVSGEISIVRMDQHGTTWIAKGACQ